jgi:hypothetical protein
MDWAPDVLYSKAKLYAERAHNEPVDSALFGFWMSLALELLARAALSDIHPVLLADPREQDNIHYAFGIIPKNVPKSIPAKALFARCSVLIPGFTDKMAAHCLIIAGRRNSELHTGAAAFESIDNSKWLPASYEVAEVLLAKLTHDFEDFLGDHAEVAIATLKDRRDSIKTDVQIKLAQARAYFQQQTPEQKTELAISAPKTIEAWLKGSTLRRKCTCPACRSEAVLGGETVSRTAPRIDEDNNTISREVRVLPNSLRCAFCKLRLNSFQEMREADIGNIYTIGEDEDPMEFFGIVPEDHVDVDEIIRKYGEDMADGYDNE